MIFLNQPDISNAPEISSTGFLGEWTNENSTGDFITTFACSGCKSYGLITAKGKSKIRCKGIRQSSEVTDVLNISVFKSLVLNDIEGLEKLYDLVPDEQLKNDLKQLNESEKRLEKVRSAMLTARLILPDPQMKKMQESA